MEYFGEDRFRSQQRQVKLVKCVIAKAMPGGAFIEDGYNRARINERVSDQCGARGAGVLF